MFGFMVTADGGLHNCRITLITIIAGIICFPGDLFLQEEFRQEKHHKTTGILCRSYFTLLYYVLSIFKLPWGRRHSLQYAFIVLIANWYGVGTGMAGFTTEITAVYPG